MNRLRRRMGHLIPSGDALKEQPDPSRATGSGRDVRFGTMGRPGRILCGERPCVH